MLIKMYQFREGDNPLGLRRKARETLNLLVPKLEFDAGFGDLRVLDPVTRKYKVTTVEKLKRNIREGPLGERIRIRTPRRTFLVVSLFRPWLYLGTLPKQAFQHNWSALMRETFRHAMWQGCSWLGTYNRRRIRGGTAWSQHAWPGQAHDFAPKDTAHGDRCVSQARDKFAGKVNIIWEAPMHRNGVPEHYHLEKLPKKTGTPP